MSQSSRQPGRKTSCGQKGLCGCRSLHGPGTAAGTAGVHQDAADNRPHKYSRLWSCKCNRGCQCSLLATTLQSLLPGSHHLQTHLKENQAQCFALSGARRWPPKGSKEAGKGISKSEMICMFHLRRGPRKAEMDWSQTRLTG